MQQILVSISLFLTSMVLSSCGSSGDLFTSRPQTFPWNESIHYDTLVDSRDGRAYRTVTIGTQVWMAENLNYVPSGGRSWCYDNDARNCTTYGRLYDWPTAMSISDSFRNHYWPNPPERVQGVCPAGWHLPSNDEWSTLGKFVDSTGAAGGARLKSKTAWTRETAKTMATDTFGFRGLPTGDWYDVKGYFEDIGSSTSFISSTQRGPEDHMGRNLRSGMAEIDGWLVNRTGGVSVRCVKD